jgi:hypothetical protein
MSEPVYYMNFHKLKLEKIPTRYSPSNFRRSENLVVVFHLNGFDLSIKDGNILMGDLMFVKRPPDAILSFQEIEKITLGSPDSWGVKERKRGNTE